MWPFKKRLTVEDPVTVMRDKLIESGLETFILIVKKGDDMVVSTNAVSIRFLFHATGYLMRWADSQPKGYMGLRKIMKELSGRGGWDHASDTRQNSGLICPGEFKAPNMPFGGE